MKRRKKAGVFCPVFAVRRRGDLGIGDTEAVKELLQFSARYGFGIVQLLPINETSGDNSPYNAVSSIALEPVLAACEPGLVPGLMREDLEELIPPALRKEVSEGPVKYGMVKALKRQLMERAFDRLEFTAWGDSTGERFAEFQKREAGWVESYAWFRTIMESEGENPVWESWPEWFGSPRLAEAWLAGQSEEDQAGWKVRLRFFKFVQWVLDLQWMEVRKEADRLGIALMGDIPFGVSRHSADVWAHRDGFDLRWSGGAPPEPFFQPDEFTKVWGQNWGIPVYDWTVMEREKYAWWKRRVRGVVRHFHSFRIDHVLGFFRIYAFPWPPDRNQEVVSLSREEVVERFGALPRFLPGSDQVPEEAAINEAQGVALLRIILQAAGDAVVVAEDLGVVPKYVRPALLKLGIAGFKIPLFERNEETREYLPPEDYPEISLATFSTHDHETVLGMWEDWWKLFDRSNEADASPEEKERGVQASWELYRTLRFAKVEDRELIRDFEPRVMEGMWHRLLACPSEMVIFSITDLLLLRTRFNVPGPVAESNWSERLPGTLNEIEQENNFRRRLELVREGIVATGRCLEWGKAS
jgi:4-alpha-glucanotransferase